MAYTSSHSTTFNMRGDFIPTKSRRKMIEFKLHLKVNTWNWIRDSDSDSIRRIHTSSDDYYSSAAATVCEFPKYDDIENVVERAADNREYGLHYHEIRNMIGRAWEQVMLFIDTVINTCGVMRIVCTVDMYRCHVYVAESGSPPPVLPAVDSSLEKCEVNGDAGGCCICLEEIAGSAGLKTPCSHVFHGDCIKKWLRTSHYCPLCRCEMRTQ